MTLLRIEYSKSGFMRYLGHLDMVRLFERGLRRGQVPLLFSQGFNPHPKISFAAPLSVGYSSDAEIVEIEVEEGWPDTALPDIFKTCFPDGVDYKRHRTVGASKSLMSMMQSSDYELIWSVPQSYCHNAQTVLENLLQRPSISAMKKSKGKKDREIDLRPMVRDLKLMDSVRVENKSLFIQNHLVETSLCDLRIFVRLDAGSDSNLKPDLLMEAIAGLVGIEGGLSASPLQVQRVALYGKDGISLFELE